jgi:hypothetical protein
VITIDPNLRGCGVATWFKGKLMSANYVKNSREIGRGYEVAVLMGSLVGGHIGLKGVWICGPVVIEHPRFYGSTHQKGDPNDTLDCGIIGATCALALRNYGPVESVFPSDWKGQLPKQKMLTRIWEKLSDEEKAVVQKTNKSDTEDILDAIGIGLWKLNRLTTRKYANE